MSNIKDIHVDFTLVCPICKESLQQKKDTFTCTNCPKDFPIIFGIPDFRVSKPLSQSDRKVETRISELINLYPKNNYIDLVKTKFSQIKDSELIQKYTNSWSGTVERNKNQLKRTLDLHPRSRQRLNNKSIALDIGCGSGGMLITLSSQCKFVIGVDISMESLIFAKKLLEENNCNNVLLYCVESEFLPFLEESFDIITASNVLEHVSDQNKTLRNIYTVQKKGGFFLGDIPNRFSLMPEPHVNVRFVGFLPRKLAHSYVWFTKKRNYIGYRLLSYFGLFNLLANFYSNSFLIKSAANNSFINKLLIRSNTKLDKHFFRKFGSFFCDYFLFSCRK